MLPELNVYSEIYKGNFPNFGRPSVIGYIGLENLKYARKVSNSKVRFDLNVQIENALIKPDDLDVKLNDLLLFLLENERRLNLSLENNLETSIFFCYRGLMTCVACTPFENKEPWKIVVMLFKGNIYLCARDTEEKINRRRNKTPDEKKFSSWGYKFEQYVLSDKYKGCCCKAGGEQNVSVMRTFRRLANALNHFKHKCTKGAFEWNTPESDPNPSVAVDETEEFSLVFRTHLNNHNIVYAAEMDGIRCDRGELGPKPTLEMGVEETVKYLAKKEFIELKTSKRLEHPRQEATFRRFKTKKWWCQSFLAGVDTVLCGLRDDAGIVHDLKTFKLRELTRMSQKYWNPNVCFNFLDAFFTHVKTCLTYHIRQRHGEDALNNLQALPLISLLFEWQPGMAVQAVGSYSNEDDPILHEQFLSQFGKFDVNKC